MMNGERRIRILYDEQGLDEPHGGVSRYFTEVMKRLPGDMEYCLPMASTRNAYLQSPPFGLPAHSFSLQDFVARYCRGRYFRGAGRLYRLLACLFPRRIPSGEAANDRAVLSSLGEGDYDIYHMTSPHLYSMGRARLARGKPVVITVHDLIPEMLNFGPFRRIRRSRARLVRAASRIIAVSEHTKKDLISLYSVPEEKVTVIYHGCLDRDDDIRKPVCPGRRYVLYVGKRNSYKNFTFFAKAIAPLLRSRPSLSLFCTGSRFSDAEKTLFEDEGIAGQTIQRFVPDSQMKSLFAHADAFVYPSLYEGFGIPILDAFSAGCPVLLSESSCFPEVAGDAALYFPPGDAEALRRQLLRILSDGNVREELRAKGRRRLRFFSWEKAAARTADVYRDILSGRDRREGVDR